MDNGTEPSLPLDIPEQAEVISGQKVGYARVSSKDQNLERQTAALKKEQCFRIFTDTVSGSSTDRPGLDGALNYVRPGDQLVVTSMDRLARSLIDLHRLVDGLTARDVSVKFLKEGQTYSLNSTPIAKLMLGLLGSVAEFERSIIRERQAEGIARAKARGVYKGRAKALTGEQLAQAQEWVDAGVPKAEVARRLGIGRTTLYSYLKSGRK
ncbi:recombinase family protein [Corynebacterium casei]|uniref:recombinase family protein n=1 Tax=Corynebacterium casei TaxID=160386 RepID=UPI003FD4E6A9